MGAAQNESSFPVSTPGARPIEGTPAVLCSPDPDTRLLLKGLLRLQRHPVRTESDSADDLLELDPVAEPTVLLFEIAPGADRWEEELRAIGARHPKVRSVVIAPGGGAELDDRARCAGARAVLHRPFSIREMRTAIEAALGDATPPPARQS